MVAPHWITIFRDLPAASAEKGAAYWAEVTGTRVSPWRGAHDEFATLLAADGDPHLRVQRVAGAGGAHFDLHVREPRSAADEAIALGATEVEDLGYVVLASPAGIVFCLVSERLSRWVAPAPWPTTGHTTVIDQVCLDVPGELWQREVDFWAAFIGWPVSTWPAHQEFAWLKPPPGVPVRLLVQRVEDGAEPRVHLDGRTTDLRAETARQLALGAEVEADNQGWVIFRDPWGLPYCLAERAEL